MMRGARGAGWSSGDAATEAEVGAPVRATLFGLKSASAASRAFVTCARSSWAFVGRNADSGRDIEHALPGCELRGAQQERKKVGET
jgi:hypothetical protein